MLYTALLYGGGERHAEVFRLLQLLHERERIHFKARHTAIKEARLQQDAQRRRMLTVNPDARLAAIGGAAFVL